MPCVVTRRLRVEQAAPRSNVLLAVGLHSSTCIPIWTTRSGGILKNDVARRAFLDITAKSASFHRGMSARLVVSSVSTPRKNVVSYRLILNCGAEVAESAAGTFGSSMKPYRMVIR